MKVKWRDDAGTEHEDQIVSESSGRLVAQELAERAYHDSGSEAYREGGELVILEPPEITGTYKIVTDYEPTFTAFTTKKNT
jgi:hypothetical protein